MVTSQDWARTCSTRFVRAAPTPGGDPQEPHACGVSRDGLSHLAKLEVWVLDESESIAKGVEDCGDLDPSTDISDRLELFRTEREQVRQRLFGARNPPQRLWTSVTWL